jgi:uroporphyrinogen-III decarboxylase
LGNISSATLHHGTKEQVIAETLDCIAAARECGSIIVGCSNQVVAGTPPENLMAMIETIAEARKCDQ